MNTNPDVVAGSNLGMPSGTEVESAAFHPPVEHMHTPTCGCSTVSSTGGLRDRVQTLKSAGVEKVRTAQQAVRSKSAELRNDLQMKSSIMKSNLRHSVATAKRATHDRVQQQKTEMQSSMQTNPAKWIGIAAASGFAIGMIGRVVHWRNSHRRMTPSLIVIESTC